LTQQTMYQCGPLPFAACPPSFAGNCLECPFRGRGIVYGPFPSRRRGLSIGLNLFPCVKVCSFNCVYCFRGPTQVKIPLPEPGLGVDGETLRRSLESALRALGGADAQIRAVDFSGNGEPTLHPGLGSLIAVVRSVLRAYGLNASVGIFTNSSTLILDEVVEVIAGLDHVEAKLDTAVDWKFKAINRPHRAVSLKSVVEGLKRLRRRFRGTLAVQVMLLGYGRVVNYTEQDAQLMAQTLAEVDPDVVHVYTVYRKPRLSNVYAAPVQVLNVYARILRESGLRVEVYI